MLYSVTLRVAHFPGPEAARISSWLSWFRSIIPTRTPPVGREAGHLGYARRAEDPTEEAQPVARPMIMAENSFFIGAYQLPARLMDQLQVIK